MSPGVTPATEPRRTRSPWSLRTRLVVAVVALLAVLAAGIGTVTVVFLRQNLVERLDQQLAESMVSVNPGALDQVLRGQPEGSLALAVTSGNIAGFRLSRQNDNDLDDFNAAQRTQLLDLPLDRHAHTIDLGGAYGPYRLLAAPVNGEVVILGVPTTEIDETTLQLVTITILVSLAALIVAGVVATIVVRFTLRPLERVAATASRVSELPLASGEVVIEERVADADTDERTEVGQVGASLNRLLDHVGRALDVRERSERKVRQFVADASHELRTPLAAIRGYSELTRRSGHELPEDVTHSLRRIESESVRMTTLVEELLLLARLDEGHELHLDRVDATAVVADAVSDAVVAGPDHEWELDAPEEPVTLVGDPARLHQVVTNLLANARAHTPPGTHVLASVERAGSEVRIRVIDDGPGIDPKLQPSLFERFVRGDSSRSRRAGSTGLGLAIVQAIVAGHHGRVEVASEPGRTAFTVVLPVRQPEVATEDAAEARAALVE